MHVRFMLAVSLIVVVIFAFIISSAYHHPEVDAQDSIVNLSQEQNKHSLEE